MKLKLFTGFFIAFIILSGCDSVKREVSGLYNLTQCKYEYKSISGLSVSGMNLSSGISALNLAKLTSLFSGQSQSIPINFTLNLDVANSGESAALMNGMQYIVNIDGIQFTTGSVNQSLNVPAGGKQVLPLSVGFDLATMMQGETKNSAVNIMKNFIGMGSEKTNVSIQLKPTFMIANQRVTSPVYIPVNFSFGGK